MSNPFFDHPILNSPYEYPRRHWELDKVGQPTQKIVESRRSAKFITPIPKPKKHKAAPAQTGFAFDEGKGLSTKEAWYTVRSLECSKAIAIGIWPNGLAWGDLKNEWHDTHGQRWPTWQCAGCENPFGGTEAIDLTDGNRVHFEPITC